MSLAFFAVACLALVGVVAIAVKYYFKATIDLKAAPSHDDTWDFEFKEREKYNDAKEESPDNMKLLRKLLMERAMAGIDKLWMVKREEAKINNAQKAGILPKGVMQAYKNAATELNQELLDIKGEANSIHPELWPEDEILKRAAELLTLHRKKEAREAYERKMHEDAKLAEARRLKDEEDQAQQKLQEQRDETARSLKKRKSKKKKNDSDEDEEEDKPLAQKKKESDEAFRLLMQSEKKKKKKKKDNAKGSQKMDTKGKVKTGRQKAKKVTQPKKEKQK